MLDRAKLIAQVAKNASQIASKQDQQINLAIATWQDVIQDRDFQNKLASANLPFSIPAWQGALGVVTKLDVLKIDYTVVSCDGSQVYPDRHMGSNFYLINTGQVSLRYQANSTVILVSNPYFLTDLNQANGNIADYVDSKRHDLEMQDGFQAVLHELERAHEAPALPVIYLVDGSLIAWHLFGKSEEAQAQFLPNYLAQLKLFLEKKVPVIGYVSLPNSTDLINLLRAKIGEFDSLAGLVDADLLEHVLPIGSFTGWFKSQVSAIKNYPEILKIYFAYLNTGHEIARIELPEFVFQDPVLLKLSMQVVLDQVHKGYGYPVVLSEAHQQAVIKSLDRDFFYQVINQFSQAGKQSNQISRKLRYKQVMNF